MARIWRGLFGPSKTGQVGLLEYLMRTQGIWGFFMLFVLALSTFQVIAYLIGLAWEPASHVKLGVGFLMLTVAAGALIPLTFLKMKYQGDMVGRADILIFVLIMALVIFLLLQLKVLVPQIFSIAAVDLGRTFGLG